MRSLVKFSGSISPNPYMQRPDQFVQGRDRGGTATMMITRSSTYIAVRSMVSTTVAGTASSGHGNRSPASHFNCSDPGKPAHMEKIGPLRPLTKSSWSEKVYVYFICHRGFRLDRPVHRIKMAPGTTVYPNVLWRQETVLHTLTFWDSTARGTNLRNMPL